MFAHLGGVRRLYAQSASSGVGGKFVEVYVNDGWQARGLVGSNMNLRRKILSYFTLIATAVAAVGVALISAPVQAQQAAVAIDSDDIGGAVRGPAGPEAGVWVIAETTELPTKFTKIVVTDDQGRFVIPDLPRADYEVWVRGYGLVDSPKLRA